VDEGERYHIKIQMPPHAVILIRSIVVESPAETWTSGYRSVSVHEFKCHSNKRPFIGLSPDCPTSLQNFLRHQGYLIEISDNEQTYSFYVKRENFTADDERLILTELEKVDRPLVRLARWPGGNQSALAVTGDIDAFTLWDYGRRFWRG
jgi:hypothetical protein